VVLANPLQTKAIAHGKIKSDKVDARILAHLLRSDLIPECYVPPKEMREIRSLVRHRLSARASLIRSTHFFAISLFNICLYSGECRG